MNDDLINADFMQPVVMRTSVMEWQSSPSPNVWRKRLDLSGPAEKGRVTSVVRYDSESTFHSHPHPDGEEILVLDGVFSDESGDYPAGTFLLNPEGFEHAPFSKDGCILFVKLRQYPGMDRRQITINMIQEPWQQGPDGTSHLILFSAANYPEHISMVRIEQAASFTVPAQSGGAELFLLGGTLEEKGDAFATGDWLRWPALTDREFTAANPVTAYLKTGHLPL